MHNASRASATRRRWPWLSVRTGHGGCRARPAVCSASASVSSSGWSPRVRARKAQGLDGGEVVLERVLVADVDEAAAPLRAGLRCGTPCSRTSPAIGVAKPASRRSRLVLPRPLRPRSQTTAPGSSASSRCSNSARSAALAGEVARLQHARACGSGRRQFGGSRRVGHHLCSYAGSAAIGARAWTLPAASAARSSGSGAVYRCAAALSPSGGRCDSAAG